MTQRTVSISVLQHFPLIGYYAMIKYCCGSTIASVSSISIISESQTQDPKLIEIPAFCKKEVSFLSISKKKKMSATLGLIFMFRCVMLFPTLHAVFLDTESKSSSSPIANLMLNPGKLKLTWDSNVTVTEYICSMHVGQRIIKKTVNNKTCTFNTDYALPIHKGALFRVQTKYNRTSYSAEDRFIPQGMNGTSVENFSCVIYNISFMNCTWKAGRNAPEDTKYFLFLKYPKEDEQECPHYIRDALGRHIACSFQDVKDIKKRVYFLVNGSSNESEIQFYDEYIDLYKIEKLTPPLNITVNCSEDRLQCTVQWKQPHLSHVEGNNDKCFEYQIEIRNKKTNANPEESSNESHTVTGRRFIFQNYIGEKKYTLQIRAKGDSCLISENWGEWSEPIEFGNPDDTVLMATIVLLIIALGTILVALVIFFLCKRYCSLKKLFSPVPQPKNKFDELFQQSDKNIQREYMDLTPTKSETEEITFVEEIK
ncbi:granulocyte-macrophage colony-stimulating factor receptor subunit alpha-like isoform X1 [Dermochelys coriacea]|uniref:granulocyte-macrophage colony-stimulating factor receptor subunit alpha-like isoform X1 n=1 Tax=Dermochelys coriacea TaxID=27794 RepID=UPI001CA814CC|nr:granulocyte-macrophage colony-stimulating factor receptor subunit alpha-like isoform X1 [Dermochelys coriacea]